MSTTSATPPPNAGATLETGHRHASGLPTYCAWFKRLEWINSHSAGRVTSTGQRATWILCSGPPTLFGRGSKIARSGRSWQRKLSSFCSGNWLP